MTAPQPDCDCGHASDRHDYNAVTGMRPCDDCGCPTWEARRAVPAPGETGGAHHFDGAPVCTHPDCYALEGQPSAARCCPLGYFEAKREDAPAYEVVDAEGEPIGIRRAEDPEIASLRARLAAAEQERDANAETIALLTADREALWRRVKESCEILRVTEDDENDWPKLPGAVASLVDRAATAEREAQFQTHLREFCEKANREHLDALDAFVTLIGGADRARALLAADPRPADPFAALLARLAAAEERAAKAEGEARDAADRADVMAEEVGLVWVAHNEHPGRGYYADADNGAVRISRAWGPDWQDVGGWTFTGAHGPYWTVAEAVVAYHATALRGSRP